MDEVVVTARSVEIKRKKDRDGQDVFEVSRRRTGKAGTFNVEGSEGGTYSSWEVVLAKIADLDLPPRLLNAAKKQLDSAGFAVINVA
jgi:hypothetical protein